MQICLFEQYFFYYSKAVLKHLFFRSQIGSMIEYIVEYNYNIINFKIIFSL